MNVPGRARLWAVCRLGVLLPPFVAPLALLVLAGPRGPVAGVLVRAARYPAWWRSVIGQAIGFFPWAVALVVRALAAVVEMEQAAETLGASRLDRCPTGDVDAWAVRAWRRRAGSGRALPERRGHAADARRGRRRVGPRRSPPAATTSAPSAGSAAALALALLVGLISGTWRHAAFVAGAWPALPAVRRPAPAGLHSVLVALVGVLGLGLPLLWALVPLGSMLPRRA